MAGSLPGGACGACSARSSDLSGPIEHIGSTAITGLVAKPTIDIMVGVSSLAESLPLALQAVSKAFKLD